jgi:hypothetical protein
MKEIQRGKFLIILGFVTIAIIFLLYGRYQDPVLFTPDAIDTFLRIASGFYVILLVSFGAITLGLYRYHQQKAENTNKGLLYIIAVVTWNSKSRKIFLITFVIYGIFFSLTSGTLVYQPDLTFSYHYGVEIPSAQIAPCCGPPGYMPEILVYLTEHVGLQIIPINLVLQIIVSYLVGLNMAIAVSAITISKKKRGFSSVGAITGLFIACPTCVGSFLSIFVGTASAIALSIAITELQTLFIAITIPVLLATPFILARRLQNPDGSCAIEPMS